MTNYSIGGFQMPAPPQATLFGETFDDRTYHIYHDESEVRDHGYLLVGLLSVPFGKKEYLFYKLQKIREDYGYYGEIHFRKLAGKLNHPKSKKEKVAYEWMKLYRDRLYRDLRFSVLIVDTRSPAFKRKYYKEYFHVYNRFTALGIKAMVKRFYKHHPKVTLKIYSDGKDRKTSPNGEMIDNFHEYVPFKIVYDSFLDWLSGREMPLIRFDDPPLETIDSNEKSVNGEFIQLTDLLLGSIKQVISPAKKKTKAEIGKLMFNMLFRDRNCEKRKREYFNYIHIWRFPDEKGNATSSFYCGMGRQPNKTRGEGIASFHR